MGREMSLDALALEMKKKQEDGVSTKSYWNPEKQCFELPNSWEDIPADGTPTNDSLSGKFFQS